MRGRFVTLEGGEGAGKSTLAGALAEALAGRGVSVIRTREPGGAPGADDIRSLLVRGESERWDTISEALLVMAARREHLQRTIRPALTQGRWVVCDRYGDSTFAYQVRGRGLPQAAFEALETLIEADRPDLTLVLDVDPSLGLGRSRGAAVGEERFEKMDASFHARVRAAFLERAAADPRRCVVLDAAQAPERVLAAALDAIEQRLVAA